MSYRTLHYHPAFSAARTSGGLQVQWCVDEFDDPFEVDDYGCEHILNLDSSSRAIAHTTTAVSPDHLGQLPFNCRMLFPHILILFSFGLRSGGLVLFFVVVLDHVSSVLYLRLEAFVAQRAVHTIRFAKAKLPSLIVAGASAIARSFTARAIQFIACNA